MGPTQARMFEWSLRSDFLFWAISKSQIANFVGYRAGGHVLVGRNDEIIATEISFLRDHGYRF